jgi:hypothetical protein
MGNFMTHNLKKLIPICVSILKAFIWIDELLRNRLFISSMEYLDGVSWEHNYYSKIGFNSWVSSYRGNLISCCCVIDWPGSNFIHFIWRALHCISIESMVKALVWNTKILWVLVWKILDDKTYLYKCANLTSLGHHCLIHGWLPKGSQKMWKIQITNHIKYFGFSGKLHIEVLIS